MPSSGKYDVSKHGVDTSRVFLLLMKWPIYAFRLLRRGRFSTIAELRKDSALLNRNTSRESNDLLTKDSGAVEFETGVRSTMGSGRIASAWAGFLLLILCADSLVPFLREYIATGMVLASSLTIMVALSSITRDASGNVKQKRVVSSSIMAGIFFVVSTFPFALPWVIAYYFPRQCLLFFSAWAVFGAIINEVAVLVSHATVKRLDASGEHVAAKKDDLITSTANEELNRPRPAFASQLRKRKRKTTEQRIATVSNFTIDDKRDLEDFIVSDEGLKWWAAFLGMQACVSGAAVFIRLIADSFLMSPFFISASLLVSMSLLLESFWMTYAAGGRWLHFRKQWRFFQPLAGGRRFASMQIVAWGLFFAFLLISASDLRKPLQTTLRELEHHVVSEKDAKFLDDFILGPLQTMCHWFRLDHLPSGSAALFGGFAELIMLVSLPLFEGPLDEIYMAETKEIEKEKVLDEVIDEYIDNSSVLNLQAMESPNFEQDGDCNLFEDKSSVDPKIKHAVQMLRTKRKPNESPFSVPMWEMCADAVRTAWLSPIVLTLVKPEVTLFLVGFVFAKFVHGHSFFGFFNIYLPYVFIVLELAYLPTYLGNPRKSGSRRWWSLRGTWVYDELCAYWYVNMIRAAELNPSEKHLFGFHPHGVFPMSASYVHNTTPWMKLFPGIVPFTLTATVTHIVPFLREVTQYNGGIEVSASSFSSALHKFRSALLVPGGQHEMLLASNDPDDFMLSSKHKGFVRLALISAAEKPDEPVNLVPILNFGESEMLWNAFPASMPLQRWLVAKLRLNPAFLPIGRFNLAGVPKRVPITFVVGEPIRVPIVNGVPTEKQIDLLATRYYTAVKETFDNHKALCEGFENSRVVYQPLLEEEIEESEFSKRWAKIANDNAGSLQDAKKKKEQPPYPEIVLSFVLTNFCLFAPYFFFASSRN